jgi:hypothetical protein
MADNISSILREGDFAVLHPPIAPCEDVPNGLPGAIRLKGKCYLISVLSDANLKVLGVRFDGLNLSKAKDWIHNHYHVSASDGECTCGHSTFRSMSCKHWAAAVRMGLIPETAGQHPQSQKEQPGPINGTPELNEEETASIPF